jgi:hypothetical protein
MNVEGHGTPHLAQHDEATLPSNGVKGMFCVFCLFLPYFISSIIIITLEVVYMCSGKEKKRGRSTEQIVPITGWQTTSGHSKREDKASVSYNPAKFATECYKTIKNHVPVRLHWMKYKGDTRLLSDYYNRVVVSIYCRHFARL